MAAQQQIDDETLQRLLDGDLNAREAKHARDVIAKSEVDAARYRSFQRLHGLFRSAAVEMAAGLDSDAMFRKIEAGIAKDRPGAFALLGAWLGEFFEHRSQVWMPMAGASVVAAAVLLTFYTPEGAHESVVMAGGGERGGAEPASVVPVEASPVPSSEIVQVDFGVNSGTVFEIALAGGKSTQVVWINDDSGGAL
jgi:anti-sigma factor RsiW